MITPSEIPIDQLIQALQDENTPLNPRFLVRLSDLNNHEEASLKQIWPNLPNSRRIAIIQEVEKLSAKNTLLDYYSLCAVAVNDEDAPVRLSAVRTLWEYEHQAIIKIFLNLLHGETDPEVRAASARGLGRFIYAGEIDEIPAEKLELIENRLLDLFNHEQELIVRLAVLESLGYSSREEIPALIREAYLATDNKWKTSALLAMGRTANQEWLPEILTMLKSKYIQLQIEAARAAGELELQETVPFLLELLDDADGELRRVCIWSLSQIGGDDASERLELLYDENEDEEETDFIESALENLSFTAGAKIMPLFELPDDDETEDDDENEDFEDIESLEELLEEEEDDLD
jgi:HEAT repeat protein